MKRLVMLCVAAMTAVTFAQGRNFAGSWVLDVEKSGTKEGPPLVKVTMTDKAFTVEMGKEGEKGAKLSFNLDGTETPLERGAKGKVAWHGDKLDATIITPNGPQTVTFSRDGAWLVQEGKSQHGPMKLYFKKAPVK